MLSALVVQVPTGTFFLGAFIVSKGLLFGWAVAQVDWSERHLAIAARVGVVLIALCVLAGVINFVARGPWEALLASDANASEARSFLPSLIGPFTHPIDFGQFMALAFLAVAAWRAAVGRSALTLVLLLATAMSALASARRTSIGGLVVGWLWMQAKVRSTSVLVALLAGLPIVIIVLAGPLRPWAWRPTTSTSGRATLRPAPCSRGTRSSAPVQSIATVTFTGPPTMALIFGLVGVVAALSGDGDCEDGAGAGAGRRGACAVRR